MTHFTRRFSSILRINFLPQQTSTQRQSKDFIKHHSGEINAFHFKSFSPFFFCVCCCQADDAFRKKEPSNIVHSFPLFFLNTQNSIEKEANTQKTRFVEQ
jgi:hypothetical protein